MQIDRLVQPGVGDIHGGILTDFSKDTIFLSHPVIFMAHMMHLSFSLQHDQTTSE